MAAKDPRDTLLYKSKSAYDVMTDDQRAAMEKYCGEYKHFLDASKTERECVVTAVYLAQTHGFRQWEPGMALKPGDRIYYVNRDKAIILAVMGREPLSCGCNIAAAHTDAPRLDMKPMPLYEDTELAYFKTHYYGGLRKYQWVATPLVIHGTVVLADGSVIMVKVGDDPRDSQFVITDLLPHLGRKQGEQPLDKAIAAETLNILVGGRPLADDEGTDRVKVEVLRLLHEVYGICEEDLISAELQAVPAAMARDMGFDRSFIGAYGHDDRVCAFAELTALLELEVPRRTAVCIFSDKEEIGSEGVSGMQSAAFDRFMGDLCRTQGVLPEECYAASFCLSADVTAAYDPNFSEAYDKKNASFVNHGICIHKYTGAGGKSGASDASAELVGRLRTLWNRAGIPWHISELGKTDWGGGGTLAKFMARRNIDTIDAGVPILSMHAPCEVVAKADCWATKQAVKAVFED